jgi:hypothetical protein
LLQLRNPLKRFNQEKKVDAVLLETSRGYSILKRTEEITGEKIIHEKKDVYTGVMPHVVEVNPDFLPIPFIFKAMWMKKRWRIRLHHKLFDEPFTRDLYTGEILNQEKKKSVLKERGFIDNDGYLLDQNGNRVSIGEVDKKAYIKVDVSDIDFIKAEYKAVADSNLVGKAATSMAKTGQSLDTYFYILLGISLITNVILVFLMQGGVESLGL